MNKVFIVDLKLLATGIGIGGLICAVVAFNPVCAMVGLGGAMTALGLRLVGG